MKKFIQMALLTVFSCSLVQAETLTVDIPAPTAPITAGFKMGASQNPAGSTISLDSQSLLLDGKRWMPAMGEFHFARYPENEWREELLKMKAGGIDIVSTYVFWIHHEEVEGQFDWSGRRNLHNFVQLCGELGLKTIIRCGPWDHGEVRNGGFPDWLQKKDWKLRSDDTNYLAKVKIFYAQIAAQLNGLLWKDGGPVIGIQVENEYGGLAQHLLTLKNLAQQAGLDVPIYTRTGWPGLASSMPFGELVPLYGVYAEGFWDRELTPMPGEVYWKGFQFSGLRTEGAFGTDIPGENKWHDGSDVSKYPYLSCEIGGGMMSSYHRRILVNPMDSLSTTLVKLGSGGASVGYYMYHGGENPEGKLSTLMESQETGMWNDMPVKNYDFQTALGQYGQIRPQYNLLRRLHLFLHEWGDSLAAMPATMPEERPAGRNDFNTLRWSARSDGNSGFIFVNNYQRLKNLEPKKDVQFQIKTAAETLTFPLDPITVPANDCFIWPFNLNLGNGVNLSWATAQPITSVEDGSKKTVFFAAKKGIEPQFAFHGKQTKVKAIAARLENSGDEIIAHVPLTGLRAALKITGDSGQVVQIVVLDETDSLAIWKGNWMGHDRAFFTHAGLVVDGDDLRLTATNKDDLALGVYPAPSGIESSGHKLTLNQFGIFEQVTVSSADLIQKNITFEKIKDAGPLRKIPTGKIDQPVATAPLEADFAQAAIWRIHIPSNVDLGTDPLLRLDYAGDVARVTLNGKLLTDDFYNGKPLEIGLSRYAPAILDGDLQISILPLRKDAPVYIAQEARPDFGDSSSIAALKAAQIIPHYQAQFSSPEHIATPLTKSGL